MLLIIDVIVNFEIAIDREDVGSVFRDCVFTGQDFTHGVRGRDGRAVQSGREYALSSSQA